MEIKTKIALIGTKLKPILKSIFLYRQTYPLFAIVQALFVMGLVLLLPVFDIIRIVDNTVVKLNEAKVVIVETLEEIPCEIEDYILTCADGETLHEFDLASAASEISAAIGNAYDEATLVFESESVQYVVDGVVQVTIEYTELDEFIEEKMLDIQVFKGKLDKYFKWARKIYTHKHLLTKTTIMIAAIAALSISMLLYLLVSTGLISVISILINRVRVRKGKGQLRHRRKIFVVATLSTVIPSLIIGILYIITGSFHFRILFVGTVLLTLYTLKTNEKINI